MGSTNGNVVIWNLLRTEKYGMGPMEYTGPGGRDAMKQVEKSSPAIASGSIAGSSGAGSATKAPPPKRDYLGDPFGVIRAHHTMEIPNVKTAIRHTAFSLSGEYMVCVGDGSNITLCQR
jgi:polycomb protein EED